MNQAQTREYDLEKPAERGWTDDQDVSLRLGVTLARCYATYAKALASRVQSYGLTTPQFGTLEALYHLGPLSLGRDMSSFKNLSMLSLVCLICTILMVIVEFPFYQAYYKDRYSDNCL